MHTQKRLKRSLLLITCFILLMTIPLVSATGFSTDGFTDIDRGHWAYGYVDDVVTREFFFGTSATTFSPDALMTRAMFVTVLSRYANTTSDDSIQTVFTDVPTEQYYTGAVAWGVSKGIVNGRSSTTFDPYGAITREETVTMIIRLVDYLHLQLPQYEVAINFTDEGTISSFAKDPMERAVQAKLIYGYPDGSVRPKGFVTRAEAAAIVSRIHELLGDDIYDPDIPMIDLPNPDMELCETPGVGSGSGGDGGSG